MKILWLTGPAGTGKTAIAGSVADTCDEQGLLAGSFFFASFTGSEKRRSKRYLVATLAYHLVMQLGNDHPLRQAILAAVERDPAIFRRRLKDQIRVILVKPFQDTRTRFDTSALPNVFIIDGLDEVEAANSRQAGKDPHEARLENERDQEEILSALLYAANDSNFPFRIIITSRPEPIIRGFFSADAVDLTREIFLDEKYNPDADIGLFLNSKFAEVRRRYRLPLSWPLAEDIQRIVITASGQFVYAATIIRFLQNTKHPRGPQGLLQTVLDWEAKDAASSALAPLDALYTRILLSSPDPPLAVQWVWAINDIGLDEAPASFVNQLLQEFEGQGAYLLENLSSLVWMPPAGDESSPYKIYHKSFIDLLEFRAGKELRGDYNGGNEVFLQGCLRVFRGASLPLIMSGLTDIHGAGNLPPASTLTASSLNIFMRHFLNGAWQRFSSDIASELGQDDLHRWDVGWWVHLLVRAFTSPRRESAVVMLFGTIHKLVCPPRFPSLSWKVPVIVTK
jgi:hypothetical protein